MKGRLYLMFHAHHTLWTAESIRAWGSGGERGVGGQWRSELLLRWGTWGGWTSFLYLFRCFRQCWRDKTFYDTAITEKQKHWADFTNFTELKIVLYVLKGICLLLRSDRVRSLAQWRRAFCTPTSLIPNCKKNPEKEVMKDHFNGHRSLMTNS